MPPKSPKFMAELHATSEIIERIFLVTSKQG